MGEMERMAMMIVAISGDLICGICETLSRCVGKGLGAYRTAALDGK